ncbi:MAG: hypothetical protein OXF22_06215 [Anaerolineaceae bacterium]|nr:hypothetical protein [Anaerolineaceae bacterium]
MKKPDKQQFEELVEATSHFLIFDAVEKDIEQEVATRTRDQLLQAPRNGDSPYQILLKYLKNPNASIAKERLRFLLSLSGGSFERFQRLYEAEWPHKKAADFWEDDEALPVIVRLLLGEASIRTELPNFVKRFFILPVDWLERLQDPILTANLVASKMTSKYSVAVGNALEDAFRRVVADITPYYTKGKVRIVENKEVDIAIPNVQEPEIMVMCSYNLTTSSSQTSRAHEQERMYDGTVRHNRLTRTNGGKAAILINVLDGGGWLSRRKDHRRMYESCDYCFAHSQLGEFRQLIQFWQRHR